MNQKEYIGQLNQKKKMIIKEMEKPPYSKVKRIPIELMYEFERIGKGDWKKGMTTTLISHNTHNPKELLMRDCDQLMYHLDIYFSETHNDKFRNFPPFFLEYLKTGRLNLKILEEK